MSQDGPPPSKRARLDATVSTAAAGVTSTMDALASAAAAAAPVATAAQTTCNSAAVAANQTTKNIPSSDEIKTAISKLESMAKIGATVNVEQLVQKMGAYIRAKNDRNIPVLQVIDMMTKCSHTTPPVVTAPSAIAATAAVSSTATSVAVASTATTPTTLQWHHKPIPDKNNPSFQRTLRRKMKKLRETMCVLVDGNIDVAFHIADLMTDNLKRSISTNKQLRAALDQGKDDDDDDDDSKNYDQIIVDNVRDYLAHPAHHSGGARFPAIQHMLDSILCACSSSSNAPSKISSRRLCRRLGLSDPKSCTRAVRNRDEVMATTEGQHIFCNGPRERKKRKDAGISRKDKASSSQNGEAKVHDDNNATVNEARLKDANETTGETTMTSGFL